MRPCVSVSGTRCTRCAPGFEFEPREDAAPGDLGDDFLESAERAFARRDDLDAPALAFGIALIHAEEIAGEERRLVAAGSGADFENGAFFIRRILRQERDLQLLFERREPRSASRAPLRRGARISAIESPDRPAGLRFRRLLAALRAVVADRCGDILELGELARERDVKSPTPAPTTRRSEISAWRRRMRSSLSCGSMIFEEMGKGGQADKAKDKAKRGPLERNMMRFGETAQFRPQRQAAVDGLHQRQQERFERGEIGRQAPSP